MVAIPVFRRLLLPFAAIPALFAQTSFEVVSIKPSAVLANGLYGNYRNAGGPGTSDPGRMIRENFDIRSLILMAYDLPRYRLVAPDWLFDIRFDVTAIVPAGTTKEQFLAMQQNLLATRLGLVVHREKKEMTVYELVTAKGGSKLRAAVAPAEPADAPPVFDGLKKDAEGFPVLIPGQTMYVSTGDRVALQGAGETMEHFASTLAGHLSAPVVDATGLTGKYDFTLKWAPGIPRPEDDPGLSLESALQQQLGLALKKTRGQVEVLVVDRVNRTATEN
jgi:uncharacterized protein (TIGR03435 family)